MQLVPDVVRYLQSSPFNNSTVAHLQIKEECLPKASTADTVSDELTDHDATGRHGMQRTEPQCIPGEDAVPSAAFARLQVMLLVGAPARWSLALTSCKLATRASHARVGATVQARYRRTRQHALSAPVHSVG